MPMKPKPRRPEYNLTLDASPLDAELKLLLEFRDEFVSALAGLGKRSAEFFRFEDGPALGAGELIVRLQPTDGFRKLSAALRTCLGELVAFKKLRHRTVSVKKRKSR